MYQEEINIPKERVAVLIGKGGRERRELEYRGKIKLKVSSDGLVTITAKNPEAIWVARRVIEAIARGFSPRKAVLLFKEGYSFEILSLTGFGAKERKDRVRLRARIIGTKGKAKETVQRYSGAEISVYGKTVAILGSAESVALARRAIETILSGSKQGTAFKFLREKFELRNSIRSKPPDSSRK